MKNCPKCRSEVEDNFDLCWNCLYSFSEDNTIGINDFAVICPKCNFENKPYLNVCSCCSADLTDFKRQSIQIKQGPKKIDCLRCNVQLEYQGNFKFHEGTRIGFFGDFFELFSNRESFDLYNCPNCGKIEFFLPDFN